MAQVFYSSIYFRPVDTAVAKTGWYINRKTITKKYKEKSEISHKEFYFDTKEQALLFLNSVSDSERANEED